MIELINSRDAYPSHEGGIPLLVVDNEWARAVISLQGAQVLSYAPKGSADLLWLSPRARLSPGEPTRGGIPLCSPWFASGSGNQEPFHGFARTSRWTLLDSRSEADGSNSLTLTLEDSKSTRRLWDHALSLKLEVSIGPRLSMDFEARNEGGEGIRLEHLWHSYLAIDNISQATLSGLEDREYIDKVDARRRKRQAGSLSFDQVTNRIYLDVPSTQTISLPGGSVKIESGTACAVVWNAWDGDAEVEDLGPGAHREYLCVERGDVDERAVCLTPGGSYRASMSIAGHRSAAIE
jgi:glucose-6-phosphate 1-epimerase